MKLLTIRDLVLITECIDDALHADPSDARHTRLTTLRNDVEHVIEAHDQPLRVVDEEAA